MNKLNVTIYVLLSITILLGFVVGFLAGYEFVGKDIENHYSKELTIAYNQLETCKKGFTSREFTINSSEVIKNNV